MFYDLKIDLLVAKATLSVLSLPQLTYQQPLPQFMLSPPGNLFVIASRILHSPCTLPTLLDPRSLWMVPSHLLNL